MTGDGRIDTLAPIQFRTAGGPKQQLLARRGSKEKRQAFINKAPPATPAAHVRCTRHTRYTRHTRHTRCARYTRHTRHTRHRCYIASACVTNVTYVPRTTPPQALASGDAGIDTSGDGLIDTVVLDTVGDGHADTLRPLDFRPVVGGSSAIQGSL